MSCMDGGGVGGLVSGRLQCFNVLGGMSLGLIGDILALTLVFASTVMNNLGQL